MERLKNILKNYVETVGPRTEVDEITTAALILQRIFGQQILDPNWTWKRFALHYIFFLLLFIYIFFGTLQTFLSTTDAELVAEACYTLIMIFIFPIKLIIFIHNRRVFQNLYLITKMYLIPAIKEDGNFDNIRRKVKKIVYLLFAMVIIPVSNYEVIALWSYMKGMYMPLSRTTSTLMPLKSPYHEIAWILHTIFICEVATTIILDMWFVVLVYLFCLASDNLVKCLEVKEKIYGEDDVQLGGCLKHFYSRHIVFVRFIKIMNEMYKWFALVPLCNAAMCICIILLLMSKDVNWTFAPHVLPMFAEILAYNYFGEQIKTKETQINMALLNFDWINLRPKDKKSYYIIITFANKAGFGIKTAIGNELSLITMTSVLQVTYRAFTVLQSVQ